MKLLRSLALLALVGATVPFSFSRTAGADDRVDALVKAGEIGAAVRLAATIEDPKERSAVLASIAATAGDRTRMGNSAGTSGDAASTAEPRCVGSA